MKKTIDYIKDIDLWMIVIILFFAGSALLMAGLFCFIWGVDLPYLYLRVLATTGLVFVAFLACAAIFDPM